MMPITARITNTIKTTTAVMTPLFPHSVSDDDVPSRITSIPCDSHLSGFKTNILESLVLTDRGNKHAEEYLGVVT